MRLATWNVNSLAVRLPRLIEWLDDKRPDVLCLQETKVSNDAFPDGELKERGYQIAKHGTGRWNGVAILSRIGLDDVRTGFPSEPGFPDLEARALSATCGTTRVWSVYVPNGRETGSPAFTYKMNWLTGLHRTIATEIETQDLVICGDFNVAPSDDDVWDPDVFVGSTHVTPEERSAIRELCGLGLSDIQPTIVKGRPFTYWDYRAGNFHKGLGMRIDLVLASAGLAERIREAVIDRDARKGKLPSDHAPVIVDFAD
jgi:exodeoxyribonuclease-3